MLETKWRAANITPVFIKTGTFRNDTRPKYRPAPWRIVQLDGAQYIEPVGLGGSDRMAEAYADNNAERAASARNGYGFCSAPLLVDDGAVGDGSDSLLGLTAFGTV